MTTERERFSLRLQLERAELPLDFYALTTGDLRTVLRIIEENRSGERSHASWLIDTDEIQITASVNVMSVEELQDIISDTYEGFRAGDQEENEWPPAVAREAQTIIKRIIARVKRTAKARLEVQGHDTLYIESGAGTVWSGQRERHGLP